MLDSQVDTYTKGAACSHADIDIEREHADARRIPICQKAMGRYIFGEGHVKLVSSSCSKYKA
jgi:hypothetical protein